MYIQFMFCTPTATNKLYSLSIVKTYNNIIQIRFSVSFFKYRKKILKFNSNNVILQIFMFTNTIL